jgi:hypothetical protein
MKNGGGGGAGAENGGKTEQTVVGEIQMISNDFSFKMFHKQGDQMRL